MSQRLSVIVTVVLWYECMEIVGMHPDVATNAATPKANTPREMGLIHAPPNAAPHLLPPGRQVERG